MWIYLFSPFLAVVIITCNIQLTSICKVLVIYGSVYLWIFVILLIFNNFPHRGRSVFSANPILFGNIATLFSLIGLIYFLYTKSMLWKLIAISTFLAGFFISILSGSRNGWLAFLVTLFPLTFILYKFQVVKKNAYLILIIVTIIILSIYNSEKLSSFITHRYDLMTSDLTNYFNNVNSRSSLGIRLESWKIAIYAFIEKPITGWGLESFNEYRLYLLNNSIIKNNANSVSWIDTHNDYFLYLTELGIFGFFNLLLFLFFPIYTQLKTHPNNTYHLQHFLITSLIINISVIVLIISSVSISQKYISHFLLLLNIIFLYSHHILLKEFK